MAFKSLNNYNEQKFGKFFLLRNDGDQADVIFLYRSDADALVADVHYIKSSEYSGYAHCLGAGCPACGKNIRVQTKLFIPVYNITSGEIQFWDRSTKFELQLQHDVFQRFPDPSQYVFRITRKGVAGDVNTTYEITAVGRNNFKSYDQILADCNASLPDYYNVVCKELTSSEMSSMLNNSGSNGAPVSDYSGYNATPRAAYEPVPEVYQPTPTIVPDVVTSPEADAPLPAPELSGIEDLGEPTF